MANSYGVLSGVEIAEAFQRQKRYAVLTQRLHAGRLRNPLALAYLAWAKRQPRIHIDNFDATPSDLGGRLNPNSYNLTLHPQLKVYTTVTSTGANEHRGVTIHDPVYRNSAVLDMRKDNPTRTIEIPSEGYVMVPGVLYLGRTVEFTRSFNVRPCLNGRSSGGRLGINIHATAGYGDAGFCGSWVLELSVVHPVRIYPHVQICQIDFVPISPRHRPYQSRKYQNQSDIVSSRMFMDFEAAAK